MSCLDAASSEQHRDGGSRVSKQGIRATRQGSSVSSRASSVSRQGSGVSRRVSSVSRQISVHSFGAEAIAMHPPHPLADEADEGDAGVYTATTQMAGNGAMHGVIHANGRLGCTTLSEDIEALPTAAHVYGSSGNQPDALYAAQDTTVLTAEAEPNLKPLELVEHSTATLMGVDMGVGQSPVSPSTTIPTYLASRANNKVGNTFVFHIDAGTGADRAAESQTDTLELSVSPSTARNVVRRP